jgi:hypothetical protein
MALYQVKKLNSPISTRRSNQQAAPSFYISISMVSNLPDFFLMCLDPLQNTV